EVIVRDSSSSWDLGPDLDHFSSRTRQALQLMNPNKINVDLLVDLLDYLGIIPSSHHEAHFDLIQLYDVLSSDKRFREKNRYFHKLCIRSLPSTQLFHLRTRLLLSQCHLLELERYHESSQMSSLVETFVSKASALQRQGRAGRYGSPEDFLSRALDAPQPQSVSNAVNLLRKIGACHPNNHILTPLGHHLASLPVNVKIGKMLIYGAILGCLEPIDVKHELMKMMEQAGFWSSRSFSSRSKQQAASLSKQQICVLNAALTAGLYDSVARVLCNPPVDGLERVACTVETPQGRAQVHPSSVNRSLQVHGWLLYQEKVPMTSSVF
ncbi:hypothetical protein GOODEAATRI_017160, partial [Goodea atripinnis]